MTYEEALVYIENTQRTMAKNRGRFASEYIEANGMAILALEKQIPKKPIDKQIVNDGYAWQYICPCCNIWQVSTEKSHCGDCGQAIDWSDEE